MKKTQKVRNNMISKKLGQLTSNFLVDMDKIYAEYVDEEGSLIMSTETLTHLTSALKSGFEMYNHVVAEKLFADDEGMQALLLDIEASSKKLEITEENAKKLNFENSFRYWEELLGKLLGLATVILANSETDDK